MLTANITIVRAMTQSVCSHDIVRERNVHKIAMGKMQLKIAQPIPLPKGT
jgi:hypothetical protein